MKLIRFITSDSPNPCFGVVVQDQAVPFAALQSKAGKSSRHLADSRSYLANLPDSERAGRELLAWGEQHLGELGKGECFPLNAVRLLEPVEVAALFDFGLTPRLYLAWLGFAGGFAGPLLWPAVALLAILTALLIRP